MLDDTLESTGMPGLEADDGGIISRRGLVLIIAIWIPILIALYFISLSNFLIFHVLVELVSVVIGFCIFAFTITSRKILDGYLVIIGIGFFCFGSVDLLHTLAYKGMNLFTNDAGLATQLWIIARYLQATTFLVAALWVGKKAHAGRWFVIMGAVTLALVASALTGVFPACYVEGSGLTMFKIASEYVIIAILAAAIVLFYRRRALLDRRVLVLILASMAFSMAAELSFTNYISVYSFFNFLGHIFKMISFFLIFLAIVEMAVSRPVSTLFRRLGDSEQRNRSLLDTTPSLVVILDVDGNIKTSNRRVAEVIANTPSLEVSAAQRSLGSAALNEGLAKTLTEGRASFNTEIMTSGGRRSILWNGAMEDLNGERLILISGLDITETEMARRKIEELNDFIYLINRMAVHDLRNRLMAVTGFIELSRTSNSKNALEKAESNAKAGVELLHRLEVLASSYQTRPDLLSTQVRQVAEAVIIASEQREHIVLEGDCMALVDEAFASVLENIINNSFRHGQAKSVTVTMAEEGDRAVVTLTDDGVGIPDEVKHNLFTSGYKYGSTGNTGMGLFIVRKLVESYGGRIEVGDNRPHGAKFRIELRRHTSADATIAE